MIKKLVEKKEEPFDGLLDSSLGFEGYPSLVHLAEFTPSLYFRDCHSSQYTMRRRLCSVPKSFHKRSLPSSLIAFSSATGKQLFREALDQGGMNAYFALSEQFLTQSEPAYCSLSSLAMVMNALNHDPKKVWKLPWRWVTEETLQCESQEICGHSLKKILANGLHFDEFESLARCHGVNITATRATSNELNIQDPLELFRNCVAMTCQKNEADVFVVVNFSRKVLGQTGSGHFSPIGNYLANRTECLT